jgi:hypothetical protein
MIREGWLMSVLAASKRWLAVVVEMPDVIDRVQLGALGGAMMLMVLGVLRLAVASHPA